jgi:4-amino-4-deoxy-L-arabinose transferase-like glycosyltransferase
VRPAWRWWGLALLWTVVNALKPLTVDDAAYFYYARQIAAAPADPYGFSVFWYQAPQPAIEILAPPVFLYWWAAAMRLLGASELAWKLAMLPWAGLFVMSFGRLAERFAGPRIATRLTAFIVLSPIFLPSLNLMLDVPALALALASLELFLRAADRHSWRTAVAAGVVCGLAIQTKYTGFLVPAVMLLHAVIHGRTRLAIVATVVAGAVAGSWEAASWLTYGQSQFIDVLHEDTGGLLRKVQLLPALVVMAGGIGSAWLFFSLTVLGLRRSLVVPGIAACLLSFLVIGWLPPIVPVGIPGWLEHLSGRAVVNLHPATDVFRLLGVLVTGAFAAVAIGFARTRDRTSTFLVAWLVVELAGYVFLNPFVASRRVMGLAVVSALILGRLAETREITAGALRPVFIYGACVATLYTVTDTRDAQADRESATRAMQIVRMDRGSTGSRVWYVGHWGFQHYTEREGMLPVEPGASRLEPGDFLVVPDPLVSAQRIELPAGRVSLLQALEVNDPIPWRTVPAYYRGASPLAVRGGAPRRRTSVYRVTESFVPGAAK